MADWGMKVSPDGIGVGTCADKDLVMSSSFNMLKTAIVGTTNGTIAHGLGYPPFFFTTSKDFSGNYTLVGDDWYSYADDTNFYPTSGTVRYYIFYQQGI